MSKRYSSYPEDKIDSLIISLTRRLKETKIDKYDFFVICSGLFSSLATRQIADVYARGQAKFTGSFARQHIHETIIKKNLMDAYNDENVDKSIK